MCRMMGIVAPHGVDAELIARFRQQARGHVAPGDSPGHGDGWGIVHYEGARPTYVGRSTGDALVDPLYDAAVDELRKRRPRGPTAASNASEDQVVRSSHDVILAHARKASAGALSVDNTHPFASGRWTFCHNGTVWGFAPDGQSDSRAIFAAILSDIERGREPEDAMRRLIDEVSCLKYTSLTCLLSNGRTLWGLRKVGNVDEECRENACSPDYYTLGVARIGDQTVVSQEHEFLRVDQWRVVPDGHVVIVPPDGHATIEKL